MNTLQHRHTPVVEALLRFEHWMSDHHGWSILGIAAFIALMFVLALLGSQSGAPNDEILRPSPYGFYYYP